MAPPARPLRDPRGKVVRDDEGRPAWVVDLDTTTPTGADAPARPVRWPIGSASAPEPPEDDDGPWVPIPLARARGQHRPIAGVGTRDEELGRDRVERER